jgi:uncharacterized protein YxeA
MTENIDKKEEVTKEIEDTTKEQQEQPTINEKDMNPSPSHLTNIKKITNKLNLLIFKSFHIFISISALVAPYITSHVPTLLFLVIYYCLIITLWYIFNGCIFTDVENYLEKLQCQYNNNNTTTSTNTNEIKEFKEPVYEDGSKKSFITSQMEYFLGEGSDKYISFFFTMVPLVNVIVCCIKIFMNVQYNDLY